MVLNELNKDVSDDVEAQIFANVPQQREKQGMMDSSEESGPEHAETPPNIGQIQGEDDMQDMSDSIHLPERNAGRKEEHNQQNV